MDVWLASFKDKIIILNKTRLGPVVTNVTKGLCRVKSNMIILCFNQAKIIYIERFGGNQTETKMIDKDMNG